jgi:predicted naringenin-chalcone synthase
MFVTGLGTAVPATHYSQEECWEALRASAHFPRLSPAARGLMQRVLLGDSGIRTRHLALGRIEEAFDVDADVLHRRFLEHAPALAARAAAVALDRAGTEPREIDAVLISTCTGYLCPGLTSYVGERLGLRADALALDLVGQGCGAALPNLRAAEALVASGRSAKVLSICVEVCSAALYIDNDPGVLVSACLFGDGAAAAVLSAEPGKGRRVEWSGGFSLSNPAERDALRMEQRGGLLRNILSREVPKVAARHAKLVLERALAERELARSDVRAWIWHAGGRPVLERLRETLALEEADTRRSAELLARFGNLSSPFVLFVLEAALAEDAPPGWWWMSSFGAGFSCHGALLKVS